MPNINVHEFADKTPELTDIIPTQSGVNGPRKYTWASLLSGILKFVNRGVSAPANLDSLWVMPDGKIYFHNGTTWVTASGAGEAESHDYFAYVSPTGDNGTYTKGDSHSPANSIAFVVAATSNTNDDIVTLFSGLHQVKNSELIRSDRTKISVKLWPGSILGSDNTTAMIVASAFNQTLIIKGDGGVSFYGVTHFIVDTLETRFSLIDLDFALLNCDGTSSNYDLAIIKSFSTNINIRIKDLVILRSCPVFDFYSVGNVAHYKNIVLGNVNMYNTAFTAYNAGLINLRQLVGHNGIHNMNVAIDSVEIAGVKEGTIFYSSNADFQKSTVNLKIKNVNSKVLLAGSIPNTPYDTSIKPALITILASNVASNNSVFNFEIDNVYTGGSLVYIGPVVMSNCVININIKNAVCTRCTPIIINGAFLDNTIITINGNILHTATNGNSAIAIIRAYDYANKSKVIITGNYKNLATNRPCVEVGTDGSSTNVVELHNAHFVCATAVPYIEGQVAAMGVAMKNVTTNSTVVPTNIVEQGQTVVRSATFN
jgi:hypothetical protein